MLVVLSRLYIRVSTALLRMGLSRFDVLVSTALWSWVSHNFYVHVSTALLHAGLSRLLCVCPRLYVHGFIMT
jgi:hypothetical protein